MSEVNCVKYGCTILPDASKCPNCGHKYIERLTEVPVKNNGNGINEFLESTSRLNR